MSIVPFLIHGRFFEEEEKRPYEKVYEATTGGDMSHKILIELDQEQEAFVRKVAEYCNTSVAKVVQSIVDQGLAAPMRPTGFFNKEQK